MADEDTLFVPEADVKEQSYNLFVDLYLKLAAVFMYSYSALKNLPRPTPGEEVRGLDYNLGVYEGFRYGALLAHSVFRPNRVDELPLFLGEVTDEQVSATEDAGEGDSG